MLPPIRYPLPSLMALALASLLAWRGEAWTRAWRSELSGRVRLAVEGPPVPNSPRPKVVAGPITRRALLLRDGVEASTRPGGVRTETIDRRMFVEVYDTWPEPGPTTHLRVGNRGPIGWIASADALGWDTRLVVRVERGRLDLARTPDGAGRESVEVGHVAMPVVGWDSAADRVELAVWDASRPWEVVARRGWARVADLPVEAWGVWISQVELPGLLRRAMEDDPALVRLRAVLGRLADNRPLTSADLTAARPALPPLAFARGLGSKASAGRLAEVNASPSADAGWSGLSFRFLPLGDLP